jgi:hypothetical protein
MGRVGFWFATVYSLYTLFAPLKFQERVLGEINIAPDLRLAV